MAKIVYFQDVPQLPVPLNTLHTIHLNAKSHDVLKEPCFIIKGGGGGLALIFVRTQF